jgi:tellurite resistance protein TehA-like permease
MTTTLVWTGVALWLALNAVVAIRVVATQPARARVRSERGFYRI